MPHAALWVVQSCMVGGTLSLRLVSMPHAAVSFRPHHRFAVPLPRSRRGGFSFTVCRLLCPMRGTRAAAKSRRSVKGLRYFSFPHRYGGSGERSEPMGALMPHAALCVVQLTIELMIISTLKFQCRTRLCVWCSIHETRTNRYNKIVSMPHAALCVVQPQRARDSSLTGRCFNAARGFVCGAATLCSEQAGSPHDCFNAARGFVGGAASSLSALVPLRGKRPFGKSPEI